MRTRSFRTAAVVGTWLALAASSCSSGVAPDDTFPRRLPEFVFGSAATDIDTGAMATAAMIGYRWVRVPIRWAMLEPTVTVKPTLTRAELAANPTLVDAFARRADWSIPDATLTRAADLGLAVIGFVGASSPPRLDGVELDPASLGADTYIACQALATQAIVERYGRARAGAPDGAPTIALWQTENELNISPAATIIGWRRPAGPLAFLGSPWASFDFQTELLRALREAVIAGDPRAITETNLSTDMSDTFNTTFGRPGWEDAVVAWRELVDVIGLDTYPNYYAAEPVDGTIVGARVARIRELALPGQQVMVVETNYPNGPAARGYSPAAQARYLEDAWTSSRDAGVAGFLPFAIADGSGADPDFSAQDQANLDVLGRALRGGDLLALALLFLTQNDWLTNRMPALTQTVEGRWGVYGPSGEALPALDVVRAIAAETAGR
ncbi:MAG: hypothetical protein IPK07_13795 [Deltaproteobacteria bacterium]|nr:hypothetical protein [Deltaproteobacteria bacterium]